jgi:NitT/TauT family transport system ATP-binding protein
MSFVTIDRASFTYRDGEAVVDKVNWTIAEGEFHCLVGRSGCGKTTLLKIAAGLLSPTEGSIHIQGKEVQEPKEEIGFVFQTPTLLEWLSVLDNVLLPISLKRAVQPSDRDKTVDLLTLMGLDQMAARHPFELSGGQQSRVAIARALINEPLVLLMDEPFAALDAITREELQDDLLHLCDVRKTTVLFVTHDIAEAVYLGDRVAVMEQGRIHHDQIVNLARPRDNDVRFSAAFNAQCLDVRKAMNAPATYKPMVGVS